MASLFDAFSSGPADEAAANKVQGLEKGTSNYLKDIQAGTNAAKGYYDTAQTRFDPLQSTLQTGQRGYDTYADLSGANGPEGFARAKAQFQTSPGYEFNRDQNLDAVTRRATQLGGGGLDSGNTLTALQDRGAGLASQEYGNYVSRLAPYLQLPGQQLALGAARSGLDTGQGQTEFLGKRLSGEASRARDVGQGQAYADAALADYNASANMLGFGMKGIDQLTKLAGMSGGGSGIGSLLSGGGAGAGGAGVGAIDFASNAGTLAAMSDRRLKQDIARVGTLNDGTPVYRFRYIGDPVMRIGVMAQDIEQTNPDAVIEVNGYKAVNYELATQASIDG